MKTIKSYADIRMDNKDILIIGEDYNGNTLLCYTPDIFIVPRRIYNKYAKECFLFLNKEHNVKIVKI